MKIHEIGSRRDIRDAVEWAYWLILGRDEEDEEVLRRHTQNCKTIAEVRRTFLTSNEFLDRSPSTEDSIFALFPKAVTLGEDGFFLDFLGTRTRCSYVPDSLSRLSGRVFGYPGTSIDELHETSEWVGTLRSVVEAKARGRLVVGELGAGWGPWLVIAAKAAAALSIPIVELVGVEGSTDHVAFMRQHLRDNGIEPADHTILHSVIGMTDGYAYFPITERGNEDWGGRAYFGNRDGSDHRFERVASLSIESLVKDHPPFDLLHCDIQGEEAEVLAASATALNARVRRIVIGTHGREIEGQLMKSFGEMRWKLEHDQPCRFDQKSDGAAVLEVDGVQVWSNPSNIPN